jgi:hypothetical protein
MDSDSEEPLKLSPPWREALRVLIARGLQDATVIERAELITLFELKTPNTAAEQQEFQLKWLSQFSAFRDELLEDHSLALRSLHGECSYQVVPAMQQTDLAIQEAQKQMKRALRNQIRMLTFIRQEDLTNEERRKNADAQAKAAMLAGMIRAPRLMQYPPKAPPPEIDPPIPAEPTP